MLKAWCELNNNLFYYIDVTIIIFQANTQINQYHKAVSLERPVVAKGRISNR